MKTQITNKPEAPEAKYPRLGQGVITGDLYVQRGPKKLWLSLNTTETREHFDGNLIEPIPVGATVQFTQE